MTTETATPSLDELHARLKEEQAEAEAADRALGAAALDSQDPKRAAKRVAEAHAAVERTRAAIAELERREEERDRHELELTAARDRHRTYVWAAEYMEACVEVQRLQEQVRVAAERLGEIAKGVTRPVGLVKSPGVGRPLAWDIETIDQDLIRNLPESRSLPGRGSRFPISGPDAIPETIEKWRAGPDVYKERVARCRELAEAEAKTVAQLEEAA